VKKTAFVLLLACLLNFFWLTFWESNIHAAEEMTKPTLNKGKKWRIGYYEGGSWQDYRESLKAVVEGLMEIGWIEKQTLPQVSISDQPATYPLWNWMASSLNSQYIEFVADAFWTSDWKEDARKISRESCIRRLKEGRVDLMFAMGTWAGQDIANNSHSIPTMVMSTTDPVQSGIIKSAEDSGLDHVHARCDPTRRQRQIRLFHDIIKFKRIGVVYDDKDPFGKVMAHLNELEEIGRERGFDVVTCSAPENQKSLQETGPVSASLLQKLRLSTYPIIGERKRTCCLKRFSRSLSIRFPPGPRAEANWLLAARCSVSQGRILTLLPHFTPRSLPGYLTASNHAISPRFSRTRCDWPSILKRQK
jgi:hypothetical protein